MKQRVGSAVDEFQGDISAHIYEESVVAHPECIFGAISVGIPRVNGSHGAGIRRDQRREREDAVAVLAAACCQSRDHSMAQSWEHTFALAAVSSWKAWASP
jgi:hypothetical protein